MANVITVTALNRYVKTLLERDPVLTDVAIKGEIQNFVHHQKSGHFYFTLKDETATVKAVMFRSSASRLSFLPENGMSVIVRCRISLFERDGSFQIYVEELFPDGLGAAQMAFEQLKARLLSEGLFAEEKKKPLPAVPKRVGLVTSKTGAAIRDIYSVAQRRWPFADFLVYDASVQGREAEQALVDGIKALDQSGLVDVIIVARGGGSREDLWVFNSERLARAAYACKTPLVSGVGHEIDFTILDFVADLRAATPTAAAELVLPDISVFADRLQRAMQIADAAISYKLTVCRQHCDIVASTDVLQNPTLIFTSRETKLRELNRQLTQAMEAKLQGSRRELAQAAALLESLSPLGALARGYCIASSNGKTIRNKQQLVPGAQLQLEFSDFAADCTVDQIIEKGGLLEKGTKI